mmetsp:Transcript_17251/g.17184  ORF Transcript_17251/g.17184 Transcript_17251/m.17184 type:complete len:204 (-) Transcript_17251:29-640(-)|eukprot:CAMPEP_0202941568 /NCGR_PEP_ID=MMETSP1395-20130829/1697_1 /ASSEMBLY_ACC=CAM_ASM_000871 /TAXON_ID=5961 /ORGANISM="Blepharisma japonicum, Strain Stock R1072" /LENGTH=203 /DNA_ID=CAMNT_0049636909 /DNA_START=755 /DNA_END=1363 /DNA_ORIENTATION=-
MDTGNNDKESDRYEHYVLVEHDHQGSEEKEDEKDEKPQKKQKREDSDFLTIKKGDVIKVICKDESGWTWGQKYNTKLKQVEGKAGWFPTSFAKNYFTAIKAERNSELNRLAQYPADFLSYCYTSGTTPAEAAVKAAGQQETHFRGLPLLEDVKDDPDPPQKAVKLMNQYFNYEEWNDHMNKIDPARRRARPNPKLKKQKKINW